MTGRRVIGAIARTGPAATATARVGEAAAIARIAIGRPATAATVHPTTGDRPPRERREPREPRPRQERPARPPVPMLPERPKPKRLKPGRAHRKQLLESLPEEQRPIAEQVLRGGVPAVREAIKEQNERLKAEGQPADQGRRRDVDGRGPPAQGPRRRMARPRRRRAERHRRARPARPAICRDRFRRSVGVRATRPPASWPPSSATAWLCARRRSTRSGSATSTPRWASAASCGRCGCRRARRRPASASRPSSAAAWPTAAGAALTADAPPDRWGAVLEAVAYSPVRSAVTPAGVPPVTDELKALVTPVATLVPEIAKQVGIEVVEGARPPRQQRRPTGPAQAQAPGPAEAGRRGGTRHAGGGAHPPSPSPSAEPEAAEPEQASGPSAEATPSSPKRRRARSGRRARSCRRAGDGRRGNRDGRRGNRARRIRRLNRVLARLGADQGGSNRVRS